MNSKNPIGFYQTLLVHPETHFSMVRLGLSLYGLWPSSGVKNTVSKLQSGYNRDLQLTKEPLMESFDIAFSSLRIFKTVIEKIEVNRENCIKACTPELFAADYAYELVKKGMPFRDAYKEAAKNPGKLEKINPVTNIQQKKHPGATGNLGLGDLRKTIKKSK